MGVGDYGEELFQELCEENSWGAEKIPVSEIRTPDFLVSTQKGKFIAEVSFVNREMKYGEAQSIHIGKKIRDKITDKKGQLKNQEFPTLLVLCGSRVDLGLESMRAAMYGDWTLSLEKSSGKVVDSFCGKNSYMQEQKNTSISAIASLTEKLKNKEDFGKAKPETMPCMTVYHNMYAQKPFSKGFFIENNSLSEYWFQEDEGMDA